MLLVLEELLEDVEVGVGAALRFRLEFDGLGPLVGTVMLHEHVLHEMLKFAFFPHLTESDTGAEGSHL